MSGDPKPRGTRLSGLAIWVSGFLASVLRVYGCYCFWTVVPEYNVGWLWTTDFGRLRLHGSRLPWPENTHGGVQYSKEAPRKHGDEKGIHT